MNINRYNYEEYFLLYTDNELGKDEREAVERFVEENPDLKNELTSLQGAVLHVDEEVRFPGKKELLSSNASLSIINNDNYTEYFLLYGDNELSNEEKAQVEQYVYHNPELQGEFELFLAVKAEPDRSIIFENKESLIRQASGGRVVAGWLKFTASIAAALIFLLFGYLNYNAENDVQPGPMISQNIGKDTPTKKKPLITIENNIDKPDSNKNEQPVNAGDESQGQQNNPASSENISLAQTKVQTSRATNKGSEQKSTKEKQTGKTVIEIGNQQLNEPNTETAKAMENPPALKPREVEASGVSHASEKTASISVDHVQTLHHENLQMKTPVIVARQEMETAQDSEFSIAGIPVTSNSKVGNLISRTSSTLR